MIPDYQDAPAKRKPDAPAQPAGTGWYTDSGNSAGTAHLYVRVENGMLVSKCGRQILESDRQPEGQSLSYCKRCER